MHVPEGFRALSEKEQIQMLKTANAINIVASAIKTADARMKTAMAEHALAFKEKNDAERLLSKHLKDRQLLSHALECDIDNPANLFAHEGVIVAIKEKETITVEASEIKGEK